MGMYSTGRVTGSRLGTTGRGAPFTWGGGIEGTWDIPPLGGGGPYLGDVGQPVQYDGYTLHVSGYSEVGHSVVVHDLNPTQLSVGRVHLPTEDLPYHSQVHSLILHASIPIPPTLFSAPAPVRMM